MLKVHDLGFLVKNGSFLAETAGKIGHFARKSHKTGFSGKIKQPAIFVILKRAPASEQVPGGVVPRRYSVSIFPRIS
ncbi:MAG TPA: hypothetical protein VF145_11990 [Chitinophagaceae bacterium]